MSALSIETGRAGGPAEPPAWALRLEPISGPPTPAIELPCGSSRTMIGRSQRCDHTLGSEMVSREHALIELHGGRWLVKDQGSRHGTFLNGQALEGRAATLLGEGDLLRLGPYTYQVRTDPAQGSITRTIVDRAGGPQRVEPVRDEELGRLARHRLDLLVECAGLIHSAADETRLADAVLQSALGGTGFHHAALLRPRAGLDEIEIVGCRSRAHGAGLQISFSRSLLAEASSGRVARLTDTSQLPLSVSIAELGITAALCAPIMLGPSVAAYLYLDARGDGAPREADAASFCQVIAKMTGLALANLKRLELERRHQALQAEIAAAREAQRLILPATSGRAGPVRYAMEVRPGRFVAGDLLDVIDLGAGRAAVCLGDVSGEGVAAGVIMTATQAQVHGELRRSGDPVVAVTAVNRYLCERLADGKFVSLWVGVFEPSGRVTYVDAGHGHWLLRRGGGRPGRVEHEGGIVLGIERDFAYAAETLDLGAGDRLIVYSDGLVEQRSPASEQFGWERAAEALDGGGDPRVDVERVFAALETFAGRRAFDDDTTVASIALE